MNDLWRPACLCGKTCLPVKESRVSLITTVGRLLAAVGVLLAASFRPARAAPSMLRALGIRWSVVGAPIGRGVLLAGNHISWLDIVLMMSISDHLRLVAKHEVGAWPVIGRIARSCGTIFVDRSRPKTLIRTVNEVTAALQSGQSVQVFPEGTTTCGAHPARWRPAFLQSAINAGAPVQRFTLLFSSSTGAFVDEETLFDSLWRVVRAKGLTITVLVDEPRPTGSDRRAMARKLSPARTRVA